MDDGLGFTIGSMLGGILFKRFGGKKSFQIYSCLAFVTCVAHILLRSASTHEIHGKKENRIDVSEKEEEKAHEVEKLNIQNT